MLNKCVEHVEQMCLPFWNTELKVLWQSCKKAERYYIRCHCNERHTARAEFILKQKEFQTRFRYYKRQYHKKKSTDIEHFRTDNSREFWKLLKNLGPKHTSNDAIPILAKSRNGEVIYECSEVLNIWKHTFETLFSSTSSKHRILELRTINFYICLNEMNNLIMNETIYEVETVIKHAKLNKAVGIDGLPNEASKNNFQLLLLQSYSTNY